MLSSGIRIPLEPCLRVPKTFVFIRRFCSVLRPSVEERVSTVGSSPTRLRVSISPPSPTISCRTELLTAMYAARLEPGYVSSVAFVHDGRSLTSASGEGTVKLWGTATGDCRATLDIGITITHRAIDATSSSFFTNVGFFFPLDPSLSSLSQKIVRAPPAQPTVPVPGPPPRLDGIGLSDDYV